MRMTIRTAVMTMSMMLGMTAGAGVARAQLIDGSTGQMVDAATDPMDFSLVASGQPGNIGSEVAANAMAYAQASMQSAMDAANAASANAASSATNDSAQDDTPAVPVTPATPKPAMTPNGGSFSGSVLVAIADRDAAAKIFYTTDGKKPTTDSAVYAGPITVTAKEKVRALAWDVNERPSGVTAKTFKVKG